MTVLLLHFRERIREGVEKGMKEKERKWKINEKERVRVLKKNRKKCVARKGFYQKGQEESE